MFRVDELLEATQGRLIQGRQNITVKGISIDSRTIGRQEAFMAIKGINYDGHDFIGEVIKKKTDCIIVAPPHSRKIQQQEKFKKDKRITFIEVEDTTKALGDIAHFWRNKFNIPVLAITGSNGKTTTKEMIAWILSKRFKVLKNEGTKNNHIGLPLTLLELNQNHDIAVLELGTNHLGEIKNLTQISQPNIGMITNIGPAHLEHLHNLKGVLREKYTLVENLKRPHIAILNSDDDLLRTQIVKRVKKPVIFGFGIKYRSDFFATDIKIINGKIEFNPYPCQGIKFTLRTRGYFNVYNALAATACARIFGIAYKDIVSRLAVFDFPQGRLKIIRLNKIRFIDDTYNSNPLSLKQALETLDNFRMKGKKIFIMGDMLELGNDARQFHYQAGQKAAGICDIFITVGKLSKLAAWGARVSGLDIKNIFTCESPDEAGNILFNKVAPCKDDIVLVKGSRLLRMEQLFKTC